MRTSTGRPSAAVHTDTLYCRASSRLTDRTWMPAALANATSGVVACAAGNAKPTSASTATPIFSPPRDRSTVLLSPCSCPSPAFVHRLHPPRRDRRTLADQVGGQGLRRGHRVGPRVPVAEPLERGVDREVG